MRFQTGILIKVIVFSIVCTVFTFALGVRLANTKLFNKETVYEAEFENAAGVVHGDSVKLAGVDVGRVKGFHIEEGKAVVEFTVDSDIELPDDSMAAIRWRNVLGQRFLYIYPGSSSELLEEGERISLERTDEAGDIGALLNNLGPILRAIDPEKANAFLDSVNTALVGNEVAARQLLDNSSILARELAKMDDTIVSLVESSDTVLEAYASQDDAIAEILQRLNSVGGVLENTTGDINTVLTDFAVVQKHLNRLVTENRDDIDGTLESLETVATTLADNKNQLAQTLCTTPLGIAGYFQTTSWGEWFNVRVTEVVIRDNQSKTIVQQKETEQQRGEESRPAYVSCGKGRAAQYKAPAGSPAAKDGRDTVSEGPEAILRFLLQGVGDA